MRENKASLGEELKVRLTQIDGSLPNLALMKLAHWHRSQGHEVHVTRHILPSLFEPRYDQVYGSTIFKFSADRRDLFSSQWPSAIIGGTGTLAPLSSLPVIDSRPRDNGVVVESITGQEHVGYDYSGYPEFTASIGFTQRGCRLRCGFCVVPRKEGKPKSVATIADIWRGEGYPKHLHLLDNDFFGQAEWEARIGEIVDGKFKVCLSQGINTRLIGDTAATQLAKIDYRGLDFKAKRLYTAWDNLRDEDVFFSGVDRLERAGIPAKHLMVYMLIGYDKNETWERIWYRFKRMTERGVSPYPMVFDKSKRDLVCFQRWVITGIYRFAKWPEYERETKSPESVDGWREIYA